jgi:hypothetical protein
VDPFSYINREIFLLFALVFPIDLIDTALKGLDHFRAQGPVYAATMVMWFLLCLVAAFTKGRRFHACFAVIFLIYNLAFAGIQLITSQDAPGAGLLRSR